MDTTKQISTGKRLDSLDFFRGATVAAMIWVNNPGSWSHIYGPFAHAEWHGWTPTDLIFPFFLFIVGVSIVLAFSKAMSKGMGRQELIKKPLFVDLKYLVWAWPSRLFPTWYFHPSLVFIQKLQASEYQEFYNVLL